MFKIPSLAAIVLNKIPVVTLYPLLNIILSSHALCYDILNSILEVINLNKFLLLFPSVKMTLTNRFQEEEISSLFYDNDWTLCILLILIDKFKMNPAIFLRTAVQLGIEVFLLEMLKEGYFEGDKYFYSALLEASKINSSFTLKFLLEDSKLTVDCVFRVLKELFSVPNNENIYDFKPCSVFFSACFN